MSSGNERNATLVIISGKILEQIIPGNILQRIINHTILLKTMFSLLDVSMDLPKIDHNDDNLLSLFFMR